MFLCPLCAAIEAFWTDLGSEFPNGTITYTGRRVDDTADYKCKAGTAIKVGNGRVVDQQRTCVAANTTHGTWTPEALPNCVGKMK